MKKLILILPIIATLAFALEPDKYLNFNGLKLEYQYAWKNNKDLYIDTLYIYQTKDHQQWLLKSTSVHDTN